jgi:hypothetical protein
MFSLATPAGIDFTLMLICFAQSNSQGPAVRRSHKGSNGATAEREEAYEYAATEARVAVWVSSCQLQSRFTNLNACWKERGTSFITRPDAWLLWPCRILVLIHQFAMDWIDKDRRLTFV